MDHKRILRELNNETGHLVRREKLHTVQRKASNVSGLDVSADCEDSRRPTPPHRKGTLRSRDEKREPSSWHRKRGIRMFRSFRWRSTKDRRSTSPYFYSVPDRQKAR